MILDVSWAMGKFHGRRHEKEQPQILPLRVRMTVRGGGVEA